MNPVTLDEVLPVRTCHTVPQAPPATNAPGRCKDAQPGGEVGTLGDLLRLMGANPDDSTALPVPLRRLRRGESLLHEGAPADAIYFVRGGTFKIFRTSEDGYEHVLGFACRAEVLGFDALCMDRQSTAVVALEESSVYAVQVNDLDALGRQQPAFDHVLHLAASSALAQSIEQADLMAAVAAEVRLARFLVQWSQRMASRGLSPWRFHLRMSRRDIASHLGVAHETVSRSFSTLVASGLLSVQYRDVQILAMDRLQRLSRNTRRHVDADARGGPARS
ncbi:MAG: Crp/Fnr family transcriptional regulator [Burkholderiales bacterium]